ncbi:hypothetical protein ACEPAH_8116 [Sanghuangporus vaninii]
MSLTTLEPATVPVPFLTLSGSIVRSIWVTLASDNPLVWNRTYGKRNEQADVEGPYYIADAPSRQIENGKAIMASSSMLKKFKPYLMTVRILSPEGNPISGTELDWWQSDTAGSYYHRTYTLRGRVTTDENGYAEILTVAPAPYGPGENVQRAAHFHVWIHAPQAEKGQTAYDDLTTQMYVCDGNDAKLMENDFVNYMRRVRLGNMVHSWSLPDKDVDEGRPFKNFPELESSDVITRQRVAWWNAKLAQMSDSDPGLKIVAGATAELRLNARAGWF